ncbi:hypothetical protein CL617_03880 [archaeon]|nr:hypothetical protein [archaeon]|tara:strand:+ start:20882 stop:21652 length:771 start_codon:yes stop_codon:yes gene_type:complete
MGEDKSLSFIVIAIFVLLFFFFINSQPDVTETSGVTGEAILEDTEINAVTIIVAIVVVLAVLGAIFLILKKFKKKKGVIPMAPKPGKTNVPNIPGVPNAPVGNAPSAPGKDLPSASSGNFGDTNLNEKEISSLFKEPPVKPIKNKQKSEPFSLDTSLEKPGENKKEKTLVNLNELRNIIIKLMAKNYGKDQITSFLQSKGWTIQQISKAVEDINAENLRIYIRKAKTMGMNTDQILKSLLDNGWDINLIKRVLPKK